MNNTRRGGGEFPFTIKVKKLRETSAACLCCVHKLLTGVFVPLSECHGNEPDKRTD